MRLAYLKLNGYKRFKKATVNLDRSLIAFVGANEAGKSSIFQALVHMENRNPILKKELTKDIQFDDDDDIIELVYFIEEHDRKKIIEFNGVGEPTFYHRIKRVNGKTQSKLNAEIKRDIKLRYDVYLLLNSIIAQGYYHSKFNEIIIVEENAEDGIKGYTLFNQAIDIVEVLTKDDPTLNEDDVSLIEEFEDQITNLINILSDSKRSKVEKLYSLITSLILIEKQEPPHDLFVAYLFENKPEIKFFNQSNRDLHETYTNEQIIEPPIALKNILKVANIDIDKFSTAISEQDSGEVESILIDANDNLQTTYNKYWNQDNVYPRLKLENDGLRILIKSADKFNNISDRSDGVKQFITLLAFALNSESGDNIVLLIDEAEIHLHYDAQVDIVKLFEEQQIVNSIYYSTHSAGCLPSDLGTGIRAVHQIKESNQTTKYSEIKNSVWQNASGFSPILMALGASMFAINLARRALIAEGETEPIILPRLFREASGMKNLNFQIGPGLASISIEKCKELEMEAAKVLFFVDGDGGGKGIINKLKEGGIYKNKVFSLPKGFIIEDFINKDKLLEAINDILFNFQQNKLTTKPSEIPEKNCMAFLDTECKKMNLKLPSKVLIAEKVVMVNSKKQIIKNSKKRVLKKLLEKINTKFE